jgi:hypothetical protein
LLFGSLLLCPTGLWFVGALLVHCTSFGFLGRHFGTAKVVAVVGCGLTERHQGDQQGV